MLSKSIARFEQSPLFRQYQMYTNMPQSEKQLIWKEWEEYYEKVKSTKVGRLLSKQKEALQKQEFQKVVAIATYCRENEQLFSDAPTRPVFMDPYELLQRVSDYKSKKTEYEYLKQLFDDMYEKSDEDILSA